MTGDGRAGAARPFVIEIMGPATAGKTSVVRALRERDPGIRVGFDVPRRRWFPVLVRRLAPLLALRAIRYRGDRWFTWNEMKSISFLESWLRTVRRGDPDGSPVVLDHGPVYRLARLREFGPALARDDPFERWWRSMLRGWLGVIDLVVALDAPDEILLSRVDRRGHWWLSADRPLEDKRRFIARYRAAFEDALREPVPEPPTVLRIRSDRHTPEEIAGRVLAAVARPALVPASPEASER